MFTSKERLAQAVARQRIARIASANDVAVRLHLDACVMEYKAAATRASDSKTKYVARQMLDGTMREHGYLPLDDEDIEDRFRALSSGKKFVPAHLYYSDLMDSDRRTSSARRIDAYWSAVA